MLGAPKKIPTIRPEGLNLFDQGRDATARPTPRETYLQKQTIFYKTPEYY